MSRNRKSLNSPIFKAYKSYFEKSGVLYWGYKIILLHRDSEETNQSLQSPPIGFICGYYIQIIKKGAFNG